VSDRKNINPNTGEFDFGSFQNSGDKGAGGGGVSADATGAGSDDDDLKWLNEHFSPPSETGGAGSDQGALGDLRRNQYTPVDISTLPPYETSELERLAALGMIESSSGPGYGSNVPSEGVPEMLKRLDTNERLPPERLPPERRQSVRLIDARDLADIARDPSRGFPDALKFQDREMDLFPQESRASIGRADIPVIYDPKTPGATMNRWSFETPAPITPERVYAGLKTPEERYRFLQRRADFVQRFKERRQSFDEESNIAGAALLGSGAVVGTALGAPALPGLAQRALVAGVDLADKIPIFGGLAYDTVGLIYRGVPKMVAAARNLPYAEWVGTLLKGRVIDQNWLLAADAAGITGAAAIKKIYDQAQQIETQEEAIQNLQKAVSDIQAQEEPISQAE
jgi:hypothetical protein